MVSEPKTLVVLDTNKIRNNFEWEKDYSNFEPKGDFLKVIDWIENKKLEKLVFIGLPEIVVEEIITTRCQNFNDQLEILKSSFNRLGKMDCFDFSTTVLPKDDFDYRKFIISKITEYLEKKTFIIIMKLEEEWYKKTLSILMKKSVTKEKPFTDSGRGFKDALIWEIILNFKEIGQYSNVFLLSENQRDFDRDLQEEFNKKLAKNLNLEDDTTKLIVSLENLYGSHIKHPTLLAYLKTGYFESKLIEFLIEISDVSINNFSIKEILEINETTPIDLEEFELSSTYSDDDLTSLRRVIFLFENNNQEFKAELIIESITNEIIALNYEEKD